MPGATVADIWQLALPPETILEVGEAGLTREVTWPALLRSRPPAFDPLRGGEIALVSLQNARLLDERLTLVRILKSLLELNVAAVAVVGEVDDEAKQLAAKENLPLLVLPPGSNLHRIEQSITRALIDRRSELYQRSQEIYQQLTELVITGRGVPAIVERLASLIGRPVVHEDENLTLRAFANSTLPRDEVARVLDAGRQELLAWLPVVPPSASDPPTAKFTLPALGMTRVVAPIVSRDKIAGYLSVLAPPSELGELERLAVSRGAAVCAIETVKEWAVLEAEDRLQVDLIDAVLSGDFSSADALQSRAKRLGFDINRPYAVLVFQLPVDAEPSAARAVAEGRGLARRITPIVLDSVLERELANRGIAGLVGAKGDNVTVLYPISRSTDPSALRTIATELAHGVSMQVGSKPSIGIGRLHLGLEGIRAGHRDAQQALAMGSRIFGPGCVTYFGDLGLYRLLFGVKETHDLEVFYDETLSKLVAYDGKTDGELVKTLEAYFACHASPTDAARKLHLHRNTLLYRLRRIREITGLDLDDAEVCLGLHLALRVKDVLRVMSPEFA